MNEIGNNFLLGGDKFMPEIHLRQPRFTCSTCGQFTKSKKRIQKFKETRRFMTYLSKQTRCSLFLT